MKNKKIGSAIQPSPNKLTLWLQGERTRKGPDVLVGSSQCEEEGSIKGPMGITYTPGDGANNEVIEDSFNLATAHDTTEEGS